MTAQAAEIMTKATQHASDGEYLRAAAAYSKAAKLDPTDPSIPIELCNCLIELNKFSKAVAAADQALAMDPASCKAHLARGRALLGLNRCEDACYALQEAVGLEDASSGSKSMAAQHLEQAKWLVKQQHDEAGTECPAIAIAATLPLVDQPLEELSAKEKLAYKQAQARKARQSKAGRQAMADKGTAATEIVGNLSKQAEEMATDVLGRLDLNSDSSKLRYSSERVQRFCEAQIRQLCDAQSHPTDHESYKVPVAAILPAAGNDPTDIQAQGISLAESFNGMDRHVTMLPFLRDMGRKLAAHAILLIVPKSVIQYPQVWVGDDAEARWPADCPAEADGWFVQLETKIEREVDSKMWFIERSAADTESVGMFDALGSIEGSTRAITVHGRHALHRDTFCLTRNFELFDFAKARQVARKTGKKGKKNRR
jgi:tetratricopeptide (TPR) repeat protein